MQELRFDLKRKGLLVLSFGGGQDSTTILYKLILDKPFRDSKLKGRNLVLIMSDTGDERKKTYDHVWSIKNLCKSLGIAFQYIASEETIKMHDEDGRNTDFIRAGFHTDSWASLGAQYKRNHNLAIRRNKSCTDNLKIKPIYRWMDAFCNEIMDNDDRDHKGKPHIREYAKAYGNIEVMIGFTKGEETRVKKAKKFSGGAKWWESIDKTFPLADEIPMDRGDCIDFMETSPYGSCPPSMCKMCPNITKHTLILMWHDDRAAFIEWCRHERRKIKRWAPIQEEKGKANTFALGGKLNLIGELRAAMKKFSHMTLEEIREYDFSHGHCISNGY